MNKQNQVNYSKFTAERVSKLKHLNEEQKAELLKALNSSDTDLRSYNAEHKENKSNISKDASDYLSYYDKNLNEQQSTYEDNKLGPKPSVLLEDSKEKEYLIKMFFELDKRHANYEEEKKNYTPEQLAVVNRIETESGGQVKCIVDTNFLKSFGKLTGVDYRGAGVLGKRVIVGDPENLTRESLLRHEAIHCAQQRDMGFYKWLGLSLVDSKIKQFFGPEKGTASAVDYGTDNQATDLETYINQFDPSYLQNRQKDDHKKYYNKEFLKNQYKKVRERDLEEMKEELNKLEERKERGEKLSFEEIDHMKQLKNDVTQFKKMLDNLEDDGEMRVVLVEPDVLPSKADISHKDYDHKAQVWTESLKNLEKRREIEKNLSLDMEIKVSELEEQLKTTNNIEIKAFLQSELDSYKKFLANIKGDKDKSRAKMKADRQKLLDKRIELEKDKKTE